MEQISQLNYLVSKLKGQLGEKDNMIGRSASGSDSEVKMLRQQLQAKKQENVELQSALKDMRANLKNLEVDYERKRR